VVRHPDALGWAAAKVAQICLGGPAAVATRHTSHRQSLRAQHRPWAAAARRRRAAFDVAIDALAHDLDATPVLTDFDRRRDALKAWSLSSEDWQDLIDGLPEQPMGGYVRSHTHWGEGKRPYCSVNLSDTFPQVVQQPG
jgi:hypothetical protein